MEPEMTEAKFTPGPWYVTDADYLRVREEASDYIIATIEDGGHVELEVFDSATQEANARLIRAAPDMFAALEYVWAHVELEGEAGRVVSAARKKAAK
jgi:hypothetical protein